MEQIAEKIGWIMYYSIQVASLVVFGSMLIRSFRKNKNPHSQNKTQRS